VIDDEENRLWREVAVDGNVDETGLGSVQKNRSARSPSAIDGCPKGGSPSENVIPAPTDRRESENRALVGDEGGDCDEEFGGEMINGWSVHRRYPRETDG
jgi:hypothetical protein